MQKYYYIGTLLPALSFDTQPEINFSELERLLNDNLSVKDLEKTRLIRRFFDILNLRALWMGQEFDPKGELTQFEMEEALFLHVGLPLYVYEFIETYEKDDDRVHHFPLLLAKFFKNDEVLKDPFLRHYLNFERELRLVLTVLRAKRLGRDLSAELQYEDPEEDFIAQILAQKDAKTYEPPEKYEELKILFDRFADSPLDLQRALDAYRVEKIDSLVDMSDTFSIERILAYLTQFIIISKWFELDINKGNNIVETIVKEG